MRLSFTEGSTWELTSNAHYIPSGRYTFLGQMGEFLLFAAGRKIQFGLASSCYHKLLRPVEDPASRRTSTEEFLQRYARLLVQPDAASFEGTEGMTFCALDPSLSRRFRQLRKQARRTPSSPQVHENRTSRQIKYEILATEACE